jgi:hypothetical protein
LLTARAAMVRRQVVIDRNNFRRFIKAYFYLNKRDILSKMFDHS